MSTELLRELAPRVLAALARRSGRFEEAEDATQEALLAAATQWPEQGVPERPLGWLITVGARRLADRARSESAGRHRELAEAARVPTDERVAPPADVGPGPAGDDTVTLLLLCCHPSLTPPSAIALTLRAVGGLTTAEIAHAFLVPEATMAQRISRAKQRIRAAGARFEPPPPDELADRLTAVLQVLYLIFNEGYTASSGARVHRTDLTAEAIRLTRELHRPRSGDRPGAPPEDSPVAGEIAGLLALMLLIDARRAARTDERGDLVPLAEQDRSRWNREAIAEGTELITRTLPTGRIGPYQLQAAIAAVHAEATRARDTDWPQIDALYRLLEGLDPNPVVTLNRAVAHAMAHGPAAGLALLEPLEADDRLVRNHRLPAVRAHLLELAGEPERARADYRAAARLTTSLPEQRYLAARAARLG